MPSSCTQRAFVTSCRKRQAQTIHVQSRLIVRICLRRTPFRFVRRYLFRVFKRSGTNRAVRQN